MGVVGSGSTVAGRALGVVICRRGVPVVLGGRWCRGGGKTPVVECSRAGGLVVCGVPVCRRVGNQRLTVMVLTWVLVVAVVPWV